jgi:hypothetical protein
MLHASRLILNSAKNIKDIKHNLDEMESSDRVFVADQYKNFSHRQLAFYMELLPIVFNETENNKSERLLKLAAKVDVEDKQCVAGSLKAVQGQKLEDLDITDMLTANRLFSQSCNYMALAVKDILLEEGESTDFEKAMEVKRVFEEAKG